MSHVGAAAAGWACFIIVLLVARDSHCARPACSRTPLPPCV